MRRGSSTLLSRLALALLAVLGFVAPLAAPEAARVVQTAGKPVQLAVREVASAATLDEPARDVPLPCLAAVPGPRVEPSARRYLLNHAWLV